MALYHYVVWTLKDFHIMEKPILPLRFSEGHIYIWGPTPSGGHAWQPDAVAACSGGRRGGAVCGKSGAMIRSGRGKTVSVQINKPFS